jgi:putative MATE family efflux protein
MLRLAIPVLLEQLLASLVMISDRLLTGHFFDTPEMAAITLTAYLLWLLHGIFYVLSVGATAMVARFVGAGDRRTARQTANQALLMGAVLASIVLAVGWIFCDRLVLLLQLKGESADAAAVYLRYVLWGLPFIMVEVVGIACLRGAGDMVPGLIVMAVVNVVNVGMSWSLVLGLGPLPALGWDGIAIGTLSGYVVGGLLVLGMLIRGRSGLRLQRRRLKPDWDICRRLLKIGIPGGADTLTIIGCQLFFASVIFKLGDLAAAAHGTAITVEALAFLPGIAFQAAAATMAGQYLGARQYRKASRSVWMACLVGGGIMVTLGVVFFTQADHLALALVKHESADVARQAARLLRIVALGMPALALTLILTGALRGAGDTRWPLIFSLIGFLGIRIPGAYWLAFDTLRIPLTGETVAGGGLGVEGAWYAMLADLCVRAALVLTRFGHGGWKRIEV